MGVLAAVRGNVVMGDRQARSTRTRSVVEVRRPLTNCHQDSLQASVFFAHQGPMQLCSCNKANALAR